MMYGISSNPEKNLGIQKIQQLKMGDVIAEVQSVTIILVTLYSDN
jgi:hypothetical protein